MAIRRRVVPLSGFSVPLGSHPSRISIVGERDLQIAPFLRQHFGAPPIHQVAFRIGCVPALALWIIFRAKTFGLPNVFEGYEQVDPPAAVDLVRQGGVISVPIALLLAWTGLGTSAGVVFSLLRGL